jgi:putative ABC transport system ATP-binding protein
VQFIRTAGRSRAPPGRETPTIRLDRVSKHYKVGAALVRALDGVSLSIDKGEFVAVMGPSGSGKSTLLHLMGCIDTPTSGELRFDGQDVSGLKDADLTRLRLKRVGLIFQQFYLIPTLKAIENVELPMREAGLPRAERHARAKGLLEQMGLGPRLEHYPSQLSGGEQQRVAIARALANRPEVVLADEPTGELDSKTADEILALLERLNRDGLTVVLVTHDPRVAARGSRRVELLDGRVVADRRGDAA